MQFKLLSLGAVAALMVALTSALPSPQLGDPYTQVIGDAIGQAASQGGYQTLPNGGRNVGRPGGRSNYGKRAEEEEENENESEPDFDLLGLGDEA